VGEAPPGDPLLRAAARRRHAARTAPEGRLPAGNKRRLWRRRGLPSPVAPAARLPPGRNLKSGHSSGRPCAKWARAGSEASRIDCNAAATPLQHPATPLQHYCNNNTIALLNSSTKAGNLCATPLQLERHCSGARALGHRRWPTHCGVNCGPSHNAMMCPAPGSCVRASPAFLGSRRAHVALLGPEGEGGEGTIVAWLALSAGLLPLVPLAERVADPLPVLQVPGLP
jgi:hypothetical protein